MQGEYKQRVVRILKSKLNGGNLIRAINTYAVSAVRYTAGIIKWNKEELDGMDWMTRKLLTMYGGFHPKSDVDRLYVPRSKGGRGLMSVIDIVREEEKQLDKYIQNSPEKIMKAVRTRIKYGSREIEEKDRFKTWSEKVMHGQFLRQTEDVRTEDSWL